MEYCSSVYMMPYIHDSILVNELFLPVFNSLLKELFNSLDFCVVNNCMTLTNILMLVILIMELKYIHP